MAPHRHGNLILVFSTMKYHAYERLIIFMFGVGLPGEIWCEITNVIVGWMDRETCFNSDKVTMVLGLRGVCYYHPGSATEVTHASQILCCLGEDRKDSTLGAGCIWASFNRQIYAFDEACKMSSFINWLTLRSRG